MAFGDIRVNMLVDEDGMCRCHGLLSPIHSSNGDIDRVTEELECILQRIAIWKATKKGERPLSPHFGCCVRSYFNEPLTGSRLLDLRADCERDLKDLFPDFPVRNVMVNSFERNSVTISATVASYNLTIPSDATELSKLSAQLHQTLKSLGMG
jgi:phage baseplate assembly protein W